MGEKNKTIHKNTKLSGIINWLKLQFLGEGKEDSPVDTEFISELSDIRTVGRYEIIGRLGKGSMGVVYLGRDPYIDRKVSIKISGPSSDDFTEPADKYRERVFSRGSVGGKVDAQQYRCYL